MPRKMGKERQANIKQDWNRKVGKGSMRRRLGMWRLNRAENISHSHAV